MVMEMIDGHAMVLSLMACSLIASGVSRLLTRPLYSTLARMQRDRLGLSSTDVEATEAAPVRVPDSTGAEPPAKV